jgi:ABC-2 type transport system ATP-binding protein
VRKLREGGVTIILTTHYIEEAEEMADRVGVMKEGKLALVEDKVALMRRLGKRHLSLTLKAPLATLPEALAGWSLSLGAEGNRLVYDFDAKAPDNGMPALLQKLDSLGVGYSDLETSNSTLEDIFVSLVETKRP